MIVLMVQRNYFDMKVGYILCKLGCIRFLIALPIRVLGKSQSVSDPRSFLT